MKKLKSIKVGPVKYQLVESASLLGENGQAYDGVHRPSEGKLMVRSGIPDGTYKKVVLMHEIIHACFETTGLDVPLEWRERICDALGYQIVGLIKENPQLVEYVKSN